MVADSTMHINRESDFGSDFAFFKSIFDKAPYGKILTDFKGKIKYSNTFIKPYLNAIETGDEIGQIQSYMPKTDRIQLINAINDVKNQVTDKILLKFQLYRDQLTIESFYCHAYAVNAETLLFDLYLLTMQKDEEATNQVGEKDLFNAIMKNSPDVIYFKNRKSQFIKVNDSFLQKHKFDHENEVLGKTDHDLFNEKHAEDALEDEQTIMNTNKPLFNKEEQEVFEAGREKWASSSKMPLYNATGNTVGIFGITRDITSWKKREIEVKERDQLIQAIVQKMPMVVYRYNHNDGLKILFGMRENIRTFKNSKVVRMNINTTLASLTGKIFDNNDTNDFFNFRSTSVLDNEEKNFENYLFKSYSNEQEVIGIALDDTERRQFEQKIKRSNKNLEKINKELNNFAYIISHDLKAPLRAITNLSEWIEEDLGNQMYKEVTQHMHLLRDRVDRMEHLIDGVLTYSRAVNSKADVERTDVNELLIDVIEELLIPNHIKVTLPDKKVVINYPKVRLRQVFTNLISNAVKYHEGDKGHIGIKIKKSEDNYQFTVWDDGPGIDPKYHEKVFNIFQTLHLNRQGSTGVGLSIVKKIVEENGGSIWVESQKDKGAAFHFTVPQTSKT